MAISVNWPTRVINILQADLTFVSGTIYELDLDWLRLQLKSLEDDPAGIPFVDTHRHNTQTILSGVTYSRSVEIINGYTVSFENTGTPYTVSCTGANHNVGDVTNYDGNVSLIVNNSAGLQTVTQGSGLSNDQASQLLELYRLHGLATGTTLKVTDTTRKVNDGVSDVIDQTIDDDGTTTTVERV